MHAKTTQQKFRELSAAVISVLPGGNCETDKTFLAD